MFDNEKDLFGMEELDLGSNGAFGDVSLFEEEGTLNAFAEETNSPKEEPKQEEKAEDFPELDDKSKVSWKMNYGSISKMVTLPGKTTISEMKSKIEKSEKFMKRNA